MNSEPATNQLAQDAYALSGNLLDIGAPRFDHPSLSADPSPARDNNLDPRGILGTVAKT